MMTRPSNQQWRDQVRCAETDPEAFFPEAGVSPHAARRVCAACPVRAECLTDALARRDVTYGVLGGLTPKERRDRLREQTAGVERVGWVA